MIAPRIPAPMTADFPVECPSSDSGGSHISSRQRSWLNRGKSQVVFNGRCEEPLNGTGQPDAERLIAGATRNWRAGRNPGTPTSSILQE